MICPLMSRDWERECTTSCAWWNKGCLRVEGQRKTSLNKDRLMGLIIDYQIFEGRDNYIIAGKLADEIIKNIDYLLEGDE